MFSEYSTTRFVVEPVNIVQADGNKIVTPELTYRKDLVKVNDIYQRMGIPKTIVDPMTLASLLTKMQLESKLSSDSQTIEVEVPPTRPDVLHACDIWEDAAVAFGFNRIPWTTPKVVTVAYQQPINKLTDQLRNVIAQAGFSEALTFALCSNEDNFAMVRRPDDGKTAAVIGNPKTKDFQVCRANLLSGLFKTLNSNSGMPLPIKLFEISDVVLKDPTAETGARNERRLSAVHMGKSAGFEVVQGLLDHVMKMLEVPFNKDGLQADKKAFWLLPSQDPLMFGELGAADIIFKGHRVGVLGVVHPEVLHNYELKKPVGALELSLHPFL